MSVDEEERVFVLYLGEVADHDQRVKASSDNDEDDENDKRDERFDHDE